VPDVDLVITTNELCTVLHDAAAATGTESGEQLTRVQHIFS
jgi:iron only hydrogenase large subunit-like protein